MNYPQDLLKRILDRLAGVHGANRITPEELQSTFDICYMASMIRDESREVFFRVLVTDRFRLQPGAPYGLERFVPFENPISFTPETVAKLSQALGYGDEIVVSEFHIRGVRRSPPAWLRLYDQLGMVSRGSKFPTYDYRPSITLMSDGAGQLHVAADDEPLAALGAGVVFTPAERPCPVFAVFGDTDREVYGRVNRLFELKCSRIMSDLLARIARRRHGGSVLVVPRGHRADLPEDVKVKYRITWPGLWDNICDVCSNAVEMFNIASTPVSSPGAGRTVYHRPANSPTYRAQHAALDRSVDAVEHEIRFLSGLSAVDGAIVVNDRFEVLGFGAELIVGDSRAGSVFQYDHWAAEPQPRRIDDLGMRHRSMYKYVEANPSVTGFVISQDGGVKGVHYADQAVHVYAHLGLQ